MKITVTNPNNIVQNAYYNHTELASSLIINTVAKWIDYESRSNQLDYISNLITATWYYGPVESPDKVIAEAETTDDTNILRRLKFELHDKDQLWILFPKDEVYT
jgi:hypothetical protein